METCSSGRSKPPNNITKATKSKVTLTVSARKTRKCTGNRHRTALAAKPEKILYWKLNPEDYPDDKVMRNKILSAQKSRRERECKKMELDEAKSNKSSKEELKEVNERLKILEETISVLWKRDEEKTLKIQRLEEELHGPFFLDISSYNIII